jgi:exosome complex component CSL4
MDDTELVFPGDEIAAAEEFLPGDGAYEEDGHVYASRIGTVDLDTTEFTASVEPETGTPVVLEPGDIVVGWVERIKKSMVVAEVHAHAKHPDREISAETNATLHISNVADYYVDELEDAFRRGDLIRMGVTDVEPALDVSTLDDRLGVLHRTCYDCGLTMEPRGKTLACPECDDQQKAKIAADYGSGRLTPED